MEGRTWGDIQPLLRARFDVDARFTRGCIDLAVANRNRVLNLMLALVLKPLDMLSVALGYRPTCALYTCQPRAGRAG